MIFIYERVVFKYFNKPEFIWLHKVKGVTL